jgi:hypothetical protein
MHKHETQHFSFSPYLKFTKLLDVPGMTRPFSPAQFSSDSHFVSLVCGSEIRVIRMIDCVYLQVICLNSQLERVSFNQGDRELLMLKKNSDTIIRHRLNLKELQIDSPQFSSNSIMETSCLESKLFGATRLSSEVSNLLRLFNHCGGRLFHRFQLSPRYLNWLRKISVRVTSLKLEDFDDQSLEYLMAHKDSVHELDFSSSHNLLNKHLNQLGRCPCLTPLSLTHCSKITDLSLLKFLSLQPHTSRGRSLLTWHSIVRICNI